MPERVNDRAAQHFVHQSLIEESHLGFGRMDVDVDAIGCDLDEEVDLGAALLDRRDHVRRLDRMRDRAISDDATIDEDMLGAAHWSLFA